MFKPLLVAVFLILVAALAACGSSVGDGAAPDKPYVVTTVAPITSIVENVGGERIQVHGVVPEGVNSHGYEPSPSVAKTLLAADLIIANGLFLEEPTIRMAESVKRDGVPILLLGDATLAPEDWAFDFSYPESSGHPNPHLWPEPFLALRYAELARDTLAELDPEGESYYSANLAAFQERIELLDEAIRAGIESIPPDNRRLVTYHDSWAYFARRYDVEVIGAIQPSDFSEPSPQEMARIILQVRDLEVPAVFGSEMFPSQALAQIARESGAEFIDQLADDDLPGIPGDPEHSYLGLMVKNMTVMVGALGGDTTPFQGLDTSAVFQGDSTATYPQ